MFLIQAKELGKKFLISDEVEHSVALKGYIPNFMASGPPRKREFWALRNITFDIMEGDIVGLIGHNGCGKTTLLNIISQVTEPTEGYAELRGRVGALLGANTGFHPDLNAVDNIYLSSSIMGFSSSTIDSVLEKIIRFAELEKFAYEPIKRLSSGMQMKLGLSIILILTPEIFILDEVVATLDEEFRKKVYDMISDKILGKRTAIIVNHDHEYIRRTCNIIIELEQGRIKSNSRNFSQR